MTDHLLLLTQLLRLTHSARATTQLARSVHLAAAPTCTHLLTTGCTTSTGATSAAHTATTPGASATSTSQSSGPGFFFYLDPGHWLDAAVGWLFGIMVDILQSVVGIYATASGAIPLANWGPAAAITAFARALAAGLLGARVTWEGFQLMTLRAEGAPTDPGGLLVRLAYSAAAIFAGPILAGYGVAVANGLAQGIAQVGFGGGSTITQLVALAMATNMTVKLASSSFVVIVDAIFLALFCVALLLGIFEGLVRSIEFMLLAILAPVMALGFMSGGGTADVWWRQFLVLIGAQAIQVTLFYIAASFFVAGGPGLAGVVTGPALGLATAYVALRSPAILQHYTYDPGVRQSFTQLAQTAAKYATTLFA